MAQSIGDLFVKLGFDVDESKLKSFDESIKGVYNNALKLVGLGGGAYGFYELAKGAESNAVALRNLNSELGVNMKYAEGFAAIWKQANPTDNLNKGLEITANMAHYISQMKYGGGSEFGLFGGTAADNTPEKMVARLRQGLPNVTQMFNGDTTRVSQLLQAITGSADMMNVLKMSDDQLAKAEKYRDVTDQQIDDTVKAAEALSNLQTQWDNFINHAIATLAPKAGGFLQTVNEKGVMAGIDWIGANSYIPGLVDWIGEHSFLPNPLQKGAPASNSGLPLGLRNHNPGNLQPGGVESRFKDDEEGLYYMARQLRKYGGYGYNNVDKIIDHWAPANGKGNSAETNRRYKEAIEKYLGVTGDQRLNMSDPETIANLMAPMIFREQGQNPFSKAQLENAANMTSPQVTNHTTIQIHGSDPQQTAEAAFQRFVDITYPTINNGPDY